MMAWDATAITTGQLVNLEGQATDAQDGTIADSGLSWSTAGRSLGTGSRISVADLPAGAHAITLTATSSLGITATVTVTILVRDGQVLPGPTLSAGPLHIGWQVAVGEAQPRTATLDIGRDAVRRQAGGTGQRDLRQRHR